jgi:RimJ/RimL family protein N-acetyltransferase
VNQPALESPAASPETLCALAGQYMGEALSAIIDYGFDRFGLGKVEEHAYSTNSRAIRLLRKLGFQLEDVRDDSHYFALLKKDRRNPRSCT